MTKFMRDAAVTEGQDKAWCWSTMEGASVQWSQAWGGCGWVESGVEHGGSAMEGLFVVQPVGQTDGWPMLVIPYKDEVVI